MNLTIFSRLVIGYLVIFVLAMTVSIYAISQLRQFEEVTRSIINVDNRFLEYKKKMSDIILSMIRYEKKFVIMKDEGLYQQFLRERAVFDSQLSELTLLADGEEARDMIDRLRQHKQHYQTLFDDEVGHLTSGTEYDDEKYRKDKEYAVSVIMASLRDLEEYSQGSTYQKFKKLRKADVRASKVAIVIGLVALIFGIIISIFITISITRPLSVIKKKTADIAKGNFDTEVTMPSPPEIRMLAESFNFMCSRLKEIDRMKSDFFALMSHELRTPLTTIREGVSLYIEGLQRRQEPEKQKRLLTIVHEECNRMINLVNSLLDLSKMEAGMMTYNFCKSDIPPLIARITGEMEPLAMTRNIRLETDIGGDLPLVKIDAERVLQVLRNLVGNALKFTPEEGRVRVLAQAEENVVKVSVSDSGTGISQDKIDTVFSKYHQEALGNSGKIAGTGLGLAIVRQIVNDHGGKVWVENTSEQGSTFSFVLPV
ncbi:MAG: HAMP domain-containing histidine kinase [Nitrospiraceae bacterium]|nr:MAG: HAMP domain-containing histidine kinase [Nitrospiraceae bacterium]